MHDAPSSHSFTPRPPPPFSTLVLRAIVPERGQGVLQGRGFKLSAGHSCRSGRARRDFLKEGALMAPCSFEFADGPISEPNAPPPLPP